MNLSSEDYLTIVKALSAASKSHKERATTLGRIVNNRLAIGLAANKLGHVDWIDALNDERARFDALIERFETEI